MPFLVIFSWLVSVFVLPILCCNNISHLKALMLIPMNVLRILAQRRFFIWLLFVLDSKCFVLWQCMCKCCVWVVWSTLCWGKCTSTNVGLLYHQWQQCLYQRWQQCLLVITAVATMFVGCTSNGNNIVLLYQQNQQCLYLQWQQGPSLATHGA